MIKAGQIYKEKRLPSWRKNNADTFVVCNAEYNISVIYKDGNRYEVYRGSVAPKLIEFQKGYRKNAEKMLFEIKQIDWLENGKLTDWVTDEPVFDIHLGVRYE